MLSRIGGASTARAGKPTWAGGALRPFHDRMGAIATQIDPTRLFASGTLAPYSVGGSDNFQTISASPDVDITSLHEYDEDQIESTHGPEVPNNDDGKPVTAKACMDLSTRQAWLTDGVGHVTYGPVAARGGKHQRRRRGGWRHDGGGRGGWGRGGDGGRRVVALRAAHRLPPPRAVLAAAMEPHPASSTVATTRPIRGPRITARRHHPWSTTSSSAPTPRT